MRAVIIKELPTIYTPSSNKKFINILGRRFGRILIIGYAGDSKWVCKCDCGNMFVSRSGHIRTGDTASCGCLHKEVIDSIFIKHRESSKSVGISREYKSYINAKSRCENPKNPAFAHYGGRGISFVFNSYQDFLLEVGRSPGKYFTLDRIDVNRNYEKGNLRWADWVTQARNRRNGRLITINGVTKCQAEWAIEYNTTDKSIDKRRRHHWCDECSIKLPKGKICYHKPKNLSCF